MTTEILSEQTVPALVAELVESHVTLTARIDALIETTEKQNEMLGLIAESVGPVLDSMKSSPIGMMLGMNHD